MSLMRIAVRNLTRNRRRTLLSALAIVVGVSAMVGFRGFVNGIRAVLKKGVFFPFLEAHQPDILCLQETKAERGQVG